MQSGQRVDGPGFEGAVFEFLRHLPGTRSAVQQDVNGPDWGVDGMVEFDPPSPLVANAGFSAAACVQVKFFQQGGAAKIRSSNLLKGIENGRFPPNWPRTFFFITNGVVSDDVRQQVQAVYTNLHVAIWDRSALIDLARKYPQAGASLHPFLDELAALAEPSVISKHTRLSVRVELDPRGWTRDGAFVLPVGPEIGLQGDVAKAFLADLGREREELVADVKSKRPPGFGPGRPFIVQAGQPWALTQPAPRNLIVATALDRNGQADPAAAARAVVELAIREGMSRVVMPLLGARELGAEAALEAMIPAVFAAEGSMAADLLVDIVVVRQELADLGANILAGGGLPAFERDVIPRSLTDLVDGRDVADALGIEHLARSFARLLASSHATLPLAIGLFGHWGSGKSYFMQLIRQHVRTLSAAEQAAPSGAYKANIAHITFNAWHYMDTDLWSSLALKIFDEVAAKISGKDKVDAQTIKARQDLVGKIESSHRARAEAEQVMAVAAQTRVEAMAEVADLEQQARQSATKISLAPLLKQLPASFTDKRVKGALAALGVNETDGNLAKLQEAVDQAKGLSGQFNALLPASARRWPAWVRVAAVTACALAVYWLTQWEQLQSWWQVLTGSSQRVVTTALAVGGGGAAWVVGALRRVRDAVSYGEKILPQLRALKAPQDDTELAAALENLRETEAKLQGARQQISQSEQEIERAGAELQRVNAGGLIYDFLCQRKQDRRYLDGQGVVSALRQDLEVLVRELEAIRETPEGGLPKVQRIVLYIDDLDRCEPERVVDVLQAVHLLLAFDLFAVIVAVDPRWLERSLYRRYLPGFERMSEARLRASNFSPHNYLEKIFQIPFQVPPMNDGGFSALVASLVPRTGEGVSRAGGENEAGKDEASAGAAETKADGKEDAAPSGEPTGGGTRATVAISPPSPPEPIRLETREIEFLSRLGAFIKTPRGGKRLVNVYTLARLQIGLTPEMRKAYLASDGYRAVALLLALDIGFPLVIPLIRARLSGHGEGLQAAVDAVRPDADVPRADVLGIGSQCDEIAGALARLLKDDPVTDAAILNWLPTAARFSFHDAE